MQDAFLRATRKDKWDSVSVSSTSVLVFDRVGRDEPPQILPSDLSLAHELSLQPEMIDRTYTYMDQNGHREREGVEMCREVQWESIWSSESPL